MLVDYRSRIFAPLYVLNPHELVPYRLDTVVHDLNLKLQFLFVRVGLFVDFLQILLNTLNVLEVFVAEFLEDDVQITDRVYASFLMSYVLVVKCTEHVVDPVNLLNVGKKLIAQPIALRGALHQTGDIEDLERGVDDLLGLVELYESVNTLVWYLDLGQVRVLRAEGEVLRWHIHIGERVKSGALAHVRHPDDSLIDSGLFALLANFLPLLIRQLFRAFLFFWIHDMKKILELKFINYAE